MEQLPFLTQVDFDVACDDMFTCGQATGWDIRKCQGHLIIKRSFNLGFETYGTCPLPEEFGEAEYREDDDEATLQHISLHVQTAMVEYTILLSSTYRVPVLYFNLYNLPFGGPHGVDVVYQHLVPKHSSPHLSSLGVMGAISMTVGFQNSSHSASPAEIDQNHPITDIPCFFIHPCNTAEAMKEVIANSKISGLEYLQLWLGLVGPCVGLYLPKELALKS